MRPNHRPRVFLDSNVVFSGLYSPEGAPGMVLRYFIEGRLIVVISQQILDEVVQVFKERLPEALPSLRKLLVSAPPEIVGNPEPKEVTRWAEIIHPDDAGILASAVAAQPDYLLTGDRHFFKNPGIAKKSGLRIVSPSQFLREWEEASTGSG